MSIILYILIQKNILNNTVLKESAFTPAQLLGYDDFWDAIRVERTIRQSAVTRGLAEGRKVTEFLT